MSLPTLQPRPVQPAWMQLFKKHPGRAKRQRAIFMGLAVRGEFGESIRQIAERAESAMSMAEAGQALIWLEGEFAAWRELDACQALEANGITPECR